MKETIKRLMALILVTAMCLSLFNANVWATVEPEDGSVLAMSNEECLPDDESAEEKDSAEEKPAEDFSDEERSGAEESEKAPSGMGSSETEQSEEESSKEDSSPAEKSAEESSGNSAESELTVEESSEEESSDDEWPAKETGDSSAETSPEMSPMESAVARGSCGDHLTWTLDSTGTLTISGTGEMWAYTYCEPLPIVDPDFDDIDDYVESLHNQDTDDTEPINHVDGGTWYQYHEQIKHLSIGSGVSSISSVAFCRLDQLTSVSIPGSVKRIENGAFELCSSLTEVTVPDGVQTIGDYAFYGCTALDSVTIGDTVTMIGQVGFSDCTNLTVVKLGNLVSTIGQNAFEGCSKLKQINFPDSVVSIKSSAFMSCNSLKSISFGSGLTTIGSMAFAGCTSLSSVNIDSSVTDIGDRAFEGTPWLKQMGTFAVVNGILMLYQGNDTKVVIPDGVTRIGWGVFDRYTSMTSVVIPATVTSIGSNAFARCSGLTSISFSGSLKEICSYAFDRCTGLTSVVIPGNVKSVGSGAFYDCAGLKSVIIDEGVESIEWMAFEGCSGLQNISIPGSVSSIESGIFRGCSNLSTVTLEQGVTGIEWYAFSECTGLTSITIPESVTTIESGAFGGNTAFTIYGLSGSTAQTFAEARGIPFEAISFIASLSSATVTVANKTYTGQALTPAPTVKLNGTTLKQGTDYTAFYKDNINAGTASVTVTGKGNYTGSKTAIFSISKANPVLTFASAAVTKKTTDAAFTNTLTKTTDGTVTFSSDKTTVATVNSSSGLVTIKGAGSATITANATAGTNYKSGSASYTLTVSSGDITACTITLSASSYSYDGQAKQPTVTVKDGETTLTRGTHYVVAYANNTNAGTAKVTVTGKDSYSGKQSKTFTIAKANPVLTFASATVTKKTTDAAFTNTLTKATDGTVTFSSGDTTVATVNSSSGLVTIKGAGSATITANAAAGTNYKAGSASYTLTVYSSAVDISDCKVYLDGNLFVYDGTEKKPAVTVICNAVILTKDVDYTVTYKDNVAVGRASAIVTGIGKYSNSVTSYYSIEDLEQAIQKADVVFSVQKRSANADGTVIVPVSLTKNTGLAGYSLDIQYDHEALSLVNVESLFPGSFSRNEDSLSWYTGDNVTSTGQMMLLSFTVAQAAKEGSYPVTFSMHEGLPNVVDEDVQNLSTVFEPGAVIVSKNGEENTDGAVIKVGGVQSLPGKSVEVPVSIQRNSGIAGFALVFQMPEGGNLQSVDKGDILDNGQFSANGNTVTWYSSDNMSENGLLMTLHITAPTQAGTYPVSVELKDGQPSNLSDEDGSTVPVTLKAGSITVKEACDHAWDEGTVTKAATCNEDGKKTCICCRCHETKEETIPAMGHDYQRVVTAPTCTKQGYTTYTCSRCHDSYQDDKVAALGHAWDEGTVTTEPTATKKGTKTYTCRKCGESKTEWIYKLPKREQNLAIAALEKMKVGKSAVVSVSNGVGTLTFSSSNSSVATVTGTGVVTAQAPGDFILTVTAAGNESYNPASRTLKITVRCVTPTISKAENVKGGVRLTYAGVTGAGAYRVFCRTGKGSWKAIGYSTGTSFTARTSNGKKALQSGKQYAFSLRTVSRKGTEDYTSDFDNDGKSITYVAVPTLLSAKNSKPGSLKLSWKKLIRQFGCEVQYSQNKKFKSKTKKVKAKSSAVSLTVKSLTKKKVYYIRIRAFRKEKGKTTYSAWSAVKSVKINQ